MARGRAVRQIEVQRALAGVRKAGATAEKVEVRSEGGFIIHLTPDPAPPETAEAAFDKWKAEHDARSSKGP